MSHRARIAFAVLILFGGPFWAGDLPVVDDVPIAPLAEQVRALIRDLERRGHAPPEPVLSRLREALGPEDGGAAGAIQKALDPACLAGVTVNPEGRIRAAQGDSSRELAPGKPRAFLVKIHNQAGITAELKVREPAPRAKGRAGVDVELIGERALTGRPLEYRVILVTCREPGKREARIGFDAGQGSEDLGSRSDVDILFDCSREEAPGSPPGQPR